MIGSVQTAVARFRPSDSVGASTLQMAHDQGYPVCWGLHCLMSFAAYLHQLSMASPETALQHVRSPFAGLEGPGSCGPGRADWAASGECTGKGSAPAGSTLQGAQMLCLGSITCAAKLQEAGPPSRLPARRHVLSLEGYQIQGQRKPFQECCMMEKTISDCSAACAHAQMGERFTHHQARSSAPAPAHSFKVWCRFFSPCLHSTVQAGEEQYSRECSPSCSNWTLSLADIYCLICRCVLSAALFAV